MVTVSPGTASALESVYLSVMNQRPKYVAKLGNVYFTNKLGTSLRRATAGFRDDQLPSDVHRALRHLDRLEFLTDVHKAAAGTATKAG